MRGLLRFGRGMTSEHTRGDRGRGVSPLDGLRCYLIAGLCVAFVFGSLVDSFASTTWDPPRALQFPRGEKILSWGDRPDIDMTRGGTVVSVCQQGGDLWAMSGKINGYGSPRAASDWQRFDTGTRPAIAISQLDNRDRNLVVEMHTDGGGELYYNIGILNALDQGIKWMDSSRHYRPGTMPSVALKGTHVYVAYEGTGDDKLWTEHGVARCRECGATASRCSCAASNARWYIDWVGRLDNYDRGRDPDITVNENGDVIAVHQGAASNTLWCWTGRAKGQSDVVWKRGPKQYDTGWSPSIDMNNQGDFIEVHDSGADLYSIIGRLGRRSQPYFARYGEGREQAGDVISVKYDKGDVPAVAISRTATLEVHQGIAADGLFSGAQTLQDPMSWMQSVARRSPSGWWPSSFRVNDLTVPATHNSGATMQGYNLYQCQDRDIGQQLNDGIRYFDLRVQWDSDDQTFVTHHGGLNGETLSSVIADLEDFVHRTHGELVFLQLKTEEGDYSIGSRHSVLHDELVDTGAGDDDGIDARYFLRRKSNGIDTEDIGNVRMVDILPQGNSPSRIVLLDVRGKMFDGLEDNKTFYWSPDYFQGSYAGKSQYSEMEKDQGDKYSSYCQQHDEHTRRPPFMLWWTLTYCEVYSNTMDQMVPNKLADWIETKNHETAPINVIFVDFYQAHPAYRLAYCMTAKRLRQGTWRAGASSTSRVGSGEQSARAPARGSAAACGVGESGARATRKER